jgi:hypothetical protein
MRFVYIASGDPGGDCMLVRRRRLHPSFGSVSCKIVPFTIAITGLAAAYNDNRQWVVSCQLRSESSKKIQPSRSSILGKILSNGFGDDQDAAQPCFRALH